MTELSPERPREMTVEMVASMLRGEADTLENYEANFGGAKVRRLMADTLEAALQREAKLREASGRVIKAFHDHMGYGREELNALFSALSDQPTETD